jgi:hypothetical protein
VEKKYFLQVKLYSIFSGDNRCVIQIDAGIMGTASVCCTGNLCNSAIPMKTTTMAVIFTSLIAFIFAWLM